MSVFSLSARGAGVGIALSASSVLVGVIGCTSSGCASASDARSELRAAAKNDEVDDVDAGAASADEVEIVKGVPDRGRDPAVVAIDIAGEGLCSGVLVSPRLVLTARHCVSRTVTRVSCPPSGVQVLAAHAPASLSILVGEDVASARLLARGVEIVAPSGVTLCDADIAFIVLDDPITVVKPLPLRKRGPARGDRVRAVGFGRAGDDDPAGTKLVREHVRVLSVTGAEFTVGEATCHGDSGGPALDEETGEIVGVVSRGGASCEGPDAHNVYTRVDTYAWLAEEAFTRVGEVERAEKIDAGHEDPKVAAAKRGTKQKPPSDVGGPCTIGSDCAAGVCLSEGDRQYCSRPCGTGDRCPTRYHCQKVVTGGGGATSACVNVR